MNDLTVLTENGPDSYFGRTLEGWIHVDFDDGLCLDQPDTMYAEPLADLWLGLLEATRTAHERVPVEWSCEEGHIGLIRRFSSAGTFEIKLDWESTAHLVPEVQWVDAILDAFGLFAKWASSQSGIAAALVPMRKAALDVSRIGARRNR